MPQGDGAPAAPASSSGIPKLAPKAQAKRHFTQNVRKDHGDAPDVVAQNVVGHTLPDEFLQHPGPVPELFRGTKIDRETLPETYTEELKKQGKATGRPRAVRLLKSTAIRQDKQEKAEAPPPAPPEGSVSLTEPVIRKAFNVFDCDGSGEITHEELRHIFAQLGEMPSDEELRAMILVADTKGEGIVTYEDFSKLFLAPNEALPSVDAATIQALVNTKVEEEEDEEEEGQQTEFSDSEEGY
eukprot:TRINITY_DN55623_c0_g1_i1.p1 TRINITY_DN55623_c0_g1~~TRINITY_DN55623_c0_g1_i1.p1  ORF type:complete len:241 (-),score=73.48 TRINITY_DN55623_c0_g1_i1:159-881(-)